MVNAHDRAYFLAASSVVNTVPEPSTVVLFGVDAIGLLGYKVATAEASGIKRRQGCHFVPTPP